MSIEKAHRSGDEGTVLALVLVICVVLATVVIAVTNYSTATLRYGRIVEDRSQRLSAAQAAMDDAIERLQLKRALCTTNLGTSPINTEFPVINGISSLVTCQMTATEVPPVDGWALVLTGEGTSGPLFQTNAGGRPKIEGPVYVKDYTRISLSKTTTLEKGDLWHEDDACAGGSDGEISFVRSNVNVPNLVYSPVTRGSYCTNQSWQDLFNGVVPPSGHVAAVPDAPPPLDDGPKAGTCKVFFPGRYSATNPIVLAKNNYFTNGVYVFDGVSLELKQQYVTMGSIPASEDPSYPLIAQNDTVDTCLPERQADTTEGATLYIAGSSNIDIDAGAGFEVSYRRFGDFRVSLQALSSVPVGHTIMSSKNGAQADLAFNGLVWAPYSRMAFGTIPANKDAAIRGGAVLGSLVGTVSQAGVDNFLIRVPTSEAAVELVLESTSTSDRGTTTVRVVADYRATSGELAVRSWRVLDPAETPG